MFAFTFSTGSPILAASSAQVFSMSSVSSIFNVEEKGPNFDQSA
jgi:hypothetical protein